MNFFWPFSREETNVRENGMGKGGDGMMGEEQGRKVHDKPFGLGSVRRCDVTSSTRQVSFVPNPASRSLFLTLSFSIFGFSAVQEGRGHPSANRLTRNGKTPLTVLEFMR